jgi:hypothetical protein
MIRVVSLQSALIRNLSLCAGFPARFSFRLAIRQIEVPTAERARKRGLGRFEPEGVLLIR